MTKYRDMKSTHGFFINSIRKDACPIKMMRDKSAVHKKAIERFKTA